LASRRKRVGRNRGRLSAAMAAASTSMLELPPSSAAAVVGDGGINVAAALPPLARRARRRGPLLAAALLLQCRGAAAGVCDTLKIITGFEPTSGTYTDVGVQNNRSIFMGPNGALLRFERNTVLGDTNAGARNLIHGDGWMITQGDAYRYGFKTDKIVSNLGLDQDWYTQEGATNPVKINCESCLNTPVWANGADCRSEGSTEQDGCMFEGYNCQGYAKKGWCSDGMPVAGKEAFMGALMKWPEKHCCACGGAWEPTMEDVFKRLDEEQKSVSDFEAQVQKMHTMLGEAEVALVKTAGLVGKARKGLRDVENKTNTNELTLANMTRTLTTLKVAVELENTGLNRSLDAAKLLLIKSAGIKDSAEASAGDDTLAHLEVLNRRIFDASEPTGPTSILIAEGNMAVAEKEDREFRARLNMRSRNVLSKRFRYRVNNMRKVLKKMGDCRRRSGQAWDANREPLVAGGGAQVTDTGIGAYQPCSDSTLPDDDVEDDDEQ